MTAAAHAGLAVFAKTPEISRVKTRLARDIGEDAARAVYGRALRVSEAVCRRAEELAGGMLRCYWAVAEADGVAHSRWAGMPAVHTGEGGLGSRLAQVQGWLLARHRRAILAGSDCPQVAPGLLAREARRQDGEIAVGPAGDGGFYLFSSGEPLACAAWESVEYSSSRTLAQLLAALAPREALLLGEETDIDGAASLARAAERLRGGELPEQADMAAWLERQPWWGAVRRARQGPSGADRNRS